MVLEALIRLSRGRTTIWITHDLRVAARADLILYFEGGRVLEQGTHEELIAIRGRYAALHAMQSPVLSGTNSNYALALAR